MIKNIDEANDRINQLESELDKAHTLMLEIRNICQSITFMITSKDDTSNSIIELTEKFLFKSNNED